MADNPDYVEDALAECAYEAGYEDGRASKSEEVDAAAKYQDILQEVSEFLDNYVDVLDGDYGDPRPNNAMSLKQRVDELLD